MAKEKLTPIPKHRPRRANRTAAQAPASADPVGTDLSHIVEQLRPLAVLIADLQFDPANARKHGEDNVDAIAGSLVVYGQRKPVVVNRRTGTIEAGNGTLQAALSLSWTHLAAIYVDDDPATAIGFSLADNRSAELATWGKDELRLALEGVSTANDERLDKMLADLAKEMKLVPPEENGGATQPIAPAAQWKVLVECADAEQQADLIWRLTDEGWKCSAMTS